MYAQTTTIRVPMGLMGQMREIVRGEYLPKIRIRPGFVTAFFMEQLDDPDRAELVVVWESQAAVEHFASTGVLEATIHGLSAHLPGIHVQRQGYALSVVTGADPAALEAAVRVL